MDNKMKKKRILTGVIITTLLVVLVGLTYALWSYFQISENQQLVAGDIYMKYTETSNTINIQGAMPTSTYDENEYFQFTIEGKNTYTKPIWYEIVIKWGEEPENRHTRIPDEFIRFRLTEQLQDGEEQEVIKEGKYSDFSKGTKIWVNTIGAKSKETTITYKLYMWVSDEMVLGSGDAESTSDMDMETWNNDAYVSVKVSVNGDFDEKTLDDDTPTTTPLSCFEYEEFLNEDETEVTIKDYKSELSECGTDVIIPEEINGHKVTVIADGEWSEAEEDDIKSFIGKGLTSVIIPKTVRKIGRSAFQSNRLTSVEIPDSVIELGASVFAFNNLNSVIIGDNVSSILGAAFSHNELTSIKIPDSVTKIGNQAFLENQLEKIELGNNVTTIELGAFQQNQLTEVTIGNGIKYIGEHAFEKGGYFPSNPNLSKITIDRTCDEIKNIENPPGYDSNTKYYPWLYSNAPYSAPGVTVYGSNGEVCDTF